MCSSLNVARTADQFFDQFSSKTKKKNIITLISAKKEWNEMNNFTFLRWWISWNVYQYCNAEMQMSRFSFFFFLMRVQFCHFTVDTGRSRPSFHHHSVHVVLFCERRQCCEWKERLWHCMRYFWTCFFVFCFSCLSVCLQYNAVILQTQVGH